MGIELSGFRNAIAQDGQFLSVSGQDMSEVQAANLNLEQAQDPKGTNQAASNIYLRGQLLTGIRESLLSANMMSVVRDPANANGEVLLFQDQNVQKFFEDAEKLLFGGVSTQGRNKGQYGIDTASQNLESQTVKGLFARLDALLPSEENPLVEQKDENNINNINNVNNEGPIQPQEESGYDEDDLGLVPKNLRSQDSAVSGAAKPTGKTSVVTVSYTSKGKVETSDWVLQDAPEELKRNQKMLKAKCPAATSAQKEAVMSLDANFSYSDGYKTNCRKLGACLGVNAADIGDIRLSDVEPAANGRDLVCTLTLSGGAGGIKVLVGSDGEFANYADYLECRRYMQDSADLFAAADLKAVNHVARFYKRLEQLPNGSQLANAFKSMLPGTLAKVRQTVPSGDVSLEVWWNALGFDDDVPVDNPENGQSVAKFYSALKLRTEADFRSATGREQAFGDPDYANLLKSNSYFSYLFKLKYHNVGHEPSEAQAAAIFRLDSRRMAELLGVNESEVQVPKVIAAEASEDGRFIECKVECDGTETPKTILVRSDGNAISGELRQSVLAKINMLGLDGDGMIEDLDGADYPLLAHYLTSVFDAIDTIADEENTKNPRKARSFGHIKDNEFKGCCVNILVSSVPSVRKKHPAASLNACIPDLWKELKLTGAAPKPSDAKVGEKLVMALRQRIGNEILDYLGFQDDPILKRWILPASVADYVAATKEIPSLYNENSFGQVINRFLRPDGLPYDKKVEFLKGRMSPRLSDLVSEEIQPVPLKRKVEDLLTQTKTDEKTGVQQTTYYVFQSDTRQTGTKYKLGDQTLHTVGINETQTRGVAIETLKESGYSHQQIYQLSNYLNNAGMNLFCSLGLPPYQYDSEVKILPNDEGGGGGNMRVLVTTPVIRYCCLGTLDDEKQLVTKSYGSPIGKMTNENLIREFVICKNGEMKSTDFRIQRSVRPEKYMRI